QDREEESKPKHGPSFLSLKRVAPNTCNAHQYARAMPLGFLGSRPSSPPGGRPLRARVSWEFDVVVMARTDRESSEGSPVASAILEKLDRELGQIDRPGTFCASGSVPAVLPGLEVEGLGPIGLPLTPKAAKDLIKHCHRAPYGKGEKTHVDTNVRRVWRLEPERFELKNPEWARLIEGIVGK